ncbi:hypothetical protein vBSscSF1_29 [Staphylococcus phage vB-SscS-F1]|nr:hypothetical protein vBApySJF1_29 [Arcanobacterium phage vB-ApyS-JF1]
MNKLEDLYYVLETNDVQKAFDIANMEEDSYMDVNQGCRLIISRNKNYTFSIDVTKEGFKNNRVTKPELKAIREYLSNFNRDGDVLPKITENGVTLCLDREFDLNFDIEYGEIDSLQEGVTYKTMAYAKMIGYSIVNILKDHVMVLNHQDNENKEAWFKVF